MRLWGCRVGICYVGHVDANTRSCECSNTESRYSRLQSLQSTCLTIRRPRYAVQTSQLLLRLAVDVCLV
jgi:hypothetical protein